MKNNKVDEIGMLFINYISISGLVMSKGIEEIYELNFGALIYNIRISRVLNSMAQHRLQNLLKGVRSCYLSRKNRAEINARKLS